MLHLRMITKRQVWQNINTANGYYERAQSETDIRKREKYLLGWWDDRTGLNKIAATMSMRVGAVVIIKRH